MFIGMFILCKNGKYSVWFEVKCSLDYYVLHIRQPRKCYYFRHECASEMRLRCFFYGQRLAYFPAPPVVQTFDSAFFQTNLYPTEKYSGKQLRYALERSLFSGYGLNAGA